MFQDLLAVGLIVPLLPAHLRQMGASHIAVGALGSIYSGFQLGLGPIVVSVFQVHENHAKVGEIDLSLKHKGYITLWLLLFTTGLRLSIFIYCPLAHLFIATCKVYCYPIIHITLSGT